MTQTINLK